MVFDICQIEYAYFRSTKTTNYTYFLILTGSALSNMQHHKGVTFIVGSIYISDEINIDLLSLPHIQIP
jgi:hypothetical protein